MRLIFCKAARFLRMTRRGLRKCGYLSKQVFKSNKYIYKVCKKVQAIINGTAFIHEEQDVGKIVERMCPEEERQRQKAVCFDKKITFSILVPLYNTPERFLREMIASVRYQTYEKWELCLADGSDDSHTNVGRICLEYANRDSRIKYRKLDQNRGISGNTNACIEMAAGDYIALFDHDDFLHPSVLYENMKAICETGADYLYTDEAIFNGTNIFNIIIKHCKPDFAIDDLRAVNYICHFSVFSAELLKRVGKFRSAFDGSQDHDMILRLTEKARKIYHIRKILYYWRAHSDSVAADIGVKTYAVDAAKKAVEEHLQRSGLKAELESCPAFPAVFRLKYELKSTPKVSIIISYRNRLKELKKCIRSIIRKSTYSNYEIIVVGNKRGKDKYFDNYKEPGKNDNIRVIMYDGDDTASKVRNIGAANAAGEFMVFLDDNTQVITPDWIEALLMYAQRDDVALVGAKLYYPDKTIRHAGVAIGLGKNRAAGYIYEHADVDDFGYMYRLFYAQNISAVAGTCMMVRTCVYRKLGGFDETYTAAFDDVDLCLKAREKGYLNIFNPCCEMYHFEAGCKDVDRSQKDVELFKSKWKKMIEKGDPYYNPNFSLDRSDYYIEA